MDLQEELDRAIERWREVWKTGDVDRVLQLYTEDVRVMRSGRNIVMGREQLRPTLLEFQDMGLADIQFYSDEVGSVTTGPTEAQVYQRYHEVVIREDGSEIATIYGLMIWKKVEGSWLIDMYANCPVPSQPTNTTQLKESIQATPNHLGDKWASQDIEGAMKFYDNDCLFMPPGETLKGKAAIRKHLEKLFANGYRRLTVNVESVSPMFEVYIVSHLVHVTYPRFSIANSEGKIIVSGSGNAILRRAGEEWKITQAIWNAV